MRQDARKLVGICGLYCGTCQNYLAYQENDVEQLEKISQSTNIPMEEIRCDGCLSDKLFPLCVDCRHGFRRCAGDKKVTWCFQCPDFPCQRLEDFTGVHVVDGISHHANVIEDLRDMKERGIEQWVEKQERAGRCQECGKRLYWFARKCPSCNTQVR
ncbi:MAG TPA: DUF3795 domain-containing protein [Dehalococcoidia bacterium]|nr:DUF3795 domain-containing protein [Dehalococcoidia bacterium]